MDFQFRIPTQDQAQVAGAWEFSSNRKARNLKEHLAYWLRRMAQRLDGRLTLALEWKSNPQLSSQEWSACVVHGIDRMRESAKQVLFAAAVDERTSEVFPELHEKDT